jgi:hypothetical protein
VLNLLGQAFHGISDTCGQTADARLFCMIDRVVLGVDADGNFLVFLRFGESLVMIDWWSNLGWLISVSVL